MLFSLFLTLCCASAVVLLNKRFSKPQKTLDLPARTSRIQPEEVQSRHSVNLAGLKPAAAQGADPRNFVHKVIMEKGAQLPGNLVGRDDLIEAAGIQFVLPGNAQTDPEAQHVRSLALAQADKIVNSIEDLEKAQGVFCNRHFDFSAWGIGPPLLRDRKISRIILGIGCWATPQQRDNLDENTQIWAGDTVFEGPEGSESYLGVTWLDLRAR